MCTIKDAEIVINQLNKSVAGRINIAKTPAGFIEYWYLETESSVWLKMEFTLENPTDSLEFDYEFLSGVGAEGYLTIYFDGVVAGHIDERYKEVGIARSPRFTLGNIDPGSHTLAFRIDSYTETVSSVKIMDLKFSHQYTNLFHKINVLDVRCDSSSGRNSADAVIIDGKINLVENLSDMQELVQ